MLLHVIILQWSVCIQQSLYRTRTAHEKMASLEHAMFGMEKLQLIVDVNFNDYKN